MHIMAQPHMFLKDESQQQSPQRLKGGHVYCQPLPEVWPGGHTEKLSTRNIVEQAGEARLQFHSLQGSGEY